MVKTFDSHNDISKYIKEIELQDKVYLRRGNSQSITSYNNRKNVSLNQSFKICASVWQYFDPVTGVLHKIRPYTGVLPSSISMSA